MAAAFLGRFLCALDKDRAGSELARRINLDSDSSHVCLHPRHGYSRPLATIINHFIPTTQLRAPPMAVKGVKQKD